MPLNPFPQTPLPEAKGKVIPFSTYALQQVKSKISLP